MNKDAVYLGDRVYVGYDANVQMVWLRTQDHNRNMCTNEIWLEDSVLSSFQDFIKSLKEVTHE